MSRATLGVTLIVVSLLWGVLMSFWFLLGFLLVISGGGHSRTLPVNELLTGDLQGVLGTGIGALWPVAGLIFGVYLRFTADRPPTARDAIILAVLAAAVVLAPIGLVLAAASQS